MCGIYGMVSLTARPLAHPGLLPRMGALLKHRGPDGSGIQREPGAALGVERLRIIDRDRRADQPLTAPGPLWLACNGEIYNADALRSRFSHFPFRTATDVEAVLPAYQRDGWRCAAALDGMFALAVWDAARRTLILARDRAGEKPLFYSVRDGEIWFASEIPPLLIHPAASRDVDLLALRDFLELGYVPSPATLFPGVRALEPGTVLVLRRHERVLARYWEPPQPPSSIPPGPTPVASAVARLRDTLEHTVRAQCRADVAIGVFSSGGLDSSVVTALAARVVDPAALWAFVARVEPRPYDEGLAARRVARWLGLRQVDVPAGWTQLAGALERAREFAEPVADPAVLPTLLLARAAREHVGVVLAGEGADELFGGYPTYIGHRLAPVLRAMPAPVMKTLDALIRALPTSHGKVPLEFLLKRLMAHAGDPWPARHIAWFGSGLPQTVLRPRPSGDSALDLRLARLAGSRDELHLAMRLDFSTYLPDDLLVKLDRCTMAYSLEARAPFLSAPMLAQALALPATVKVRHIRTKDILKRAAEAWLPPFLVRRRKRGLSVPVAQWINGALAPEVDRLLDRGRLTRQGLIDPEVARGLLAAHRSRRANHARGLWTLVVLQYWMERWLGE